MTASSETNSDYAEVIGLNFAKTLAIGASTEKENNLHKPENDSLGALYSFYDLNITVKQENGKVLAKGKKQQMKQNHLGKSPITGQENPLWIFFF